MSSLVSQSKSARLRRHVLILLTIGLGMIPGPTFATDYNVDFQAVTCPSGGPADFGGIALVLQGAVNPNPTYINNPFRDGGWEVSSGTCATGNTLVSWAINTFGGPCIGNANPIVHVGVSVGGPSVTVLYPFLYSTVAVTSPCELTVNLPTTDACNPANYQYPCDLPLPGPRNLLADPILYQPLASTAWYVHADGKSLTVINGYTWPPRPCTKPVYVGDVRFSYYATRQPLSTLNADSLGEPISSVGLEDREVVPCSDTSTVSVFSNPPDAANYVVVSATQDTVPDLDSPGASHIWIQEAIVREGEHVIGTDAGPHGGVSPFGPVVVASGASQTFTITPDAGFRVADVLVDGVSVGAVTTYTFSNVTADHRIAATFAPLNSPPDCRQVRAVPVQLWPPNHRLVTVKLAGLADPDGDPVAAKIVRVTQDEPSGSGPHRPDAVVDSTETCQLLAERDGNGNGRVYTLWYTASDGRGGECGGSVQVCVPHDRNDLECIDDGPVDEGLHPRSEVVPGVRNPDAGRLQLGRTSISGHQAIVEYAIPSAGMVQLALFDVSGRRLVTIENSARAEGLHQAVWDTRGIASGIYFYRLRAGSEEVVKALRIR